MLMTDKEDIPRGGGRLVTPLANTFPGWVGKKRLLINHHFVLDNLPHPVSVRIYGRGNKKKAMSKATGQVEFTYVICLKRNCPYHALHFFCLRKYFGNSPSQLHTPVA